MLIECKPYHDRVEQQGAAAASTVYLKRIKSNCYVEGSIIATIYTSNPGDYTTAKFIYVGYELAGVKYYLDGHDVQGGSGTNPGCVVAKKMVIPPGARVFAYFETTSTSQKYELIVNGYIYIQKG